MRRRDPVEEAAMAYAAASEQEQGRQVDDVHAEDRGYDLVSRGPAGPVRDIEVKGRAGVGDVERMRHCVRQAGWQRVAEEGVAWEA